MALPTRVGTLQAYSSGTDPAEIDVSGIADGSWMLLVAAAGSTSATLTAPSGWTTLVSPFNMNTRKVAVFGKTKQNTDGVVTVPKDVSTSTSLGLVYGTGADEPSNWQIGTGKLRNTAPAESVTTTAQSITTTMPDVLALSVSVEATNAEDDNGDYPFTTGSGWTNWLYVPDVASPDATNIEQIRIGYKNMLGMGMTGNVFDTYQNSQNNNGWGIQIGITPPGSGPTVPGTITVVSHTTGGTSESGTSTSLTIDVPSGIEDGDWLVVAARSQTQSGASDFTCAGWTRVGPSWPGSSAEARVVGFYVHRVTDAAGEPTSYTFTRTSAATRNIGVMMALRGMPETGFLNVAVTDYYGTNISGGKQTESLDVTAENCLQLFLGGAEFTSPNNHVPSATPSGFTELELATTSANTGISRTALWVGYREVDQGATGTSDITWGSAINPVAQSVVFEPAPVGSGTHEVEVWDGSNRVVSTVWVYDGVDELPVQDILALPWRGYTITQMEQDINEGRTVYWAHRGGSVNFSEMTLRAYTNAFWHGVKVLEYSARRTSDGVWVGMHDSTVDRTTALSGTVASFTWADLDGVPVDTPVADGGTVSRLEQFLELYPDFVLICDNKQNTNQSEFLNLLKQVPDWQDHVIVKLDGHFTPSMAAAAKAEGFKTCAYFYDDEVDTFLPAIVDNVDYIGLNYDALQVNWDTALSYGKPVWGHVLPNMGAATTALGKGAHILQCGDVLGIVPKVNELP